MKMQNTRRTKDKPKIGIVAMAEFFRHASNNSLFSGLRNYKRIAICADPKMSTVLEQRWADALSPLDLVVFLLPQGPSAISLAEVFKQTKICAVGVLTDSENHSHNACGQTKPMATAASLVDCEVPIFSPPVKQLQDPSSLGSAHHESVWNHFAELCRCINNLSFSGAQFIDYDFEDVCSVLKVRGDARFGYGVASGKDRANQAAWAAINHPLLQPRNVAQSSALLVNISGNKSSLKLEESREAMHSVRSLIPSDCHVIVGVTHTDSDPQEIKVSLLATGCVKTYGTSLL
jgi:FtsZ family, C-terminal domain